MKNIKLFRISTVPQSINSLLKGQLNFLSHYYDVTAISGKGDLLNEVKIREKVNIYGIDIQRQISPIKDLISLIKLYWYFKKEKPQIVHSITPKAGLLSMLAAKFAGVPIRMHTFTGLIFPTKTGVLQKVLIHMDQLLCWASTNIYPEGNGVKEDLINYNITKKPLKVLANGNVNGIDLSYFSPLKYSISDEISKLKAQLGIEPLDFVFIFVGRLVGDKGINELATAFQKIAIACPTSKLLLVGSAEHDLDPLLEETINTIASHPQIISVGFQKDVRPYFAISDALVFPSYREGFPNVVMQAGAMGLPSIVSNINGCNEIIVPDKNGVIIPVKDIQAIANAMESFLTSSQQTSSMRKHARQMIVDRYEQSVVWEALLNEYTHLLKRL